MKSISINDRPFWLDTTNGAEIRVFADSEGLRAIGILYPQQALQEPRYYYRLAGRKSLTPVSGAKSQFQAVAAMVGQWRFEQERLRRTQEVAHG